MNATIEMLRHFLSKANPGPWGVKSDEPGTVWVLDDSGAPYCRLADCRPGGEANAHLIAAMFDHLPALLDVAEAAEALVEGSARDGSDNQDRVCAALAKLT